MIQDIQIQLNEHLYIKDPLQSELGKAILEKSVDLIYEIGIEDFTFKKLSTTIPTTEASIYRYFENKHKLLVYLSSWYWSWMEYKLVFATANISNTAEKLKKAITIVTEKVIDDDNTTYINEAILNKIIIAEFTKTLHTKEIDTENKEGFFLIYKRVISRIILIVNEVNPEYPFAKSLVSSIVEGSLHQYFLKEHLKSITDCDERVTPTDFYLNLIENTLKK